jgi:hypothetical protein
MQRQNYQSIELSIEILMAELRAIFSATEAAEVRNFITVGEYGLALETLCGVIIDGGYTIPQSVYQQIIDLGNRMNIDRAFWELIKVE